MDVLPGVSIDFHPGQLRNLTLGKKTSLFKSNYITSSTVAFAQRLFNMAEKNVVRRNLKLAFHVLNEAWSWFLQVRVLVSVDRTNRFREKKKSLCARTSH